MKTRRITERKSRSQKEAKSSRPRHTKQPDIFLVYAPECVPVAHTSETIFQSLTARAVSVVLILFFVFVPLGDAYADTTESAPVAVEEAVVLTSDTEPMENSEPEVLEDTDTEVVEATPLDESVLPENAVEVDNTADETITSGKEVDVTTSSSEPPLEVISLPENTNTTSTTDTASTTTETVDEDGSITPSEEVATTTVEAIATPELPPTVPETTASSTETVVEEVASTTTATTTEDGVVSEVPVMTHTTDADRFLFSTTECVPVGNGAFHCVRTSDQAAAEKKRGDVYAAQDAEGDLEIYRNNGERDVPITENTYDDDAPTEDQVTGDIVWHANIDDRYQVMSYERDSGAITRLTKETYNSMQPASYDSDVVFQAWVDNDWEIVLINEEGKTVLTENDVHDIAPSINERYIMWQSYEGTAWVAKVYDRTTKDIETVEGIEGGMVENPRMVLVFDNKKENGDVETLGYNPESGETVSLVATPVKLPEKIPAPEEKQEEKALIGTTLPKIETKTEQANDASGDGNDTATSTPDTSTTADVIVVEPVLSTPPAVVPLDTSASSTIDMASPVATETPAIEDLVVPSFESMRHGTTTEQS